ncbi:MAG: DUF4340 domain-containing protein [Candidatus Rifleibacteriota bacterium]
MLKRFKPTLIAFLVLVMLLIYANYYETEKILEPGEQKPQPVIGLEADEIESVTWLQNDKENLKLQKSGQEFKITLPRTYDAAYAEVKGILDHFAELKSEMIVAENATDTSLFGISENSPEVKITGKNKAVNLLLGSKSPVGGSYYVSKKGNPRVYMVPSYIRGDFYKTVENLRNRTVFDEKFGRVSSIKLEYADKTIELENKDSIEWFINQPVTLPADSEVIAALIQKLQSLKISRFVEDEPKDIKQWGFAPYEFKISLTNDAGVKFALQTGETSANEVYFKTNKNQEIHAILRSDLQALQKTVSDLRAKYFPEIEKEKITGLELKTASETIELVKKDDEWFLNDRVVPAGEVNAFIDSYKNATVREFLSIDKKDENELENPEDNDSFVFKTEGDRYAFILGEVEGINISILHNNEIYVAGIEINNAFKKLVTKVKQATENNPVLKGNSN